MGQAGSGVGDRQFTHVAVVHGEQRVHSIMAAATAEDLTERVAEYVRANAPQQLYALDRARVSALLASGATQAAIRYYFDRVGRKWDREWLHLDVVESAAPAEATVLFMPAERMALQAG